MLYPEKNAPFSDENFKNPPAAYRGISFWAWNCAMNHEDIDFMTDMFQEMGLGGSILHSRTGMSLPYLKEEFMERIGYAVDAAEKRHLRAWLYDEDRWPSGYGGGYITSNEKYRARMLIFSPEPVGDLEKTDPWKIIANGKCTRSNNRRLLAIYSVELDEDGWLTGYRRLTEDEAENAPADTLWYAYLEISGKNPWFNDQAYANLLDPEMVREFIRVTHESYYKAVGKEFGKTIPAIFTDEPQFSFKRCLGKATDRQLISIPFTDDLPDTYLQAYGVDLMDHLPELFFDRWEGYSQIRYRYHDHLTERFVSAYADQLGEWCDQHGIALTGHVMREATLKLQSMAVGEAMRFYRAMKLPGIDMLAFRTEYNTAKQCQSAVHQFGREAMLSEMYGVTNWDFDFRGHKLLGDWQAALGCTVRTLHLSWTGMAGEAKRDYPASIGYQSPWYKEYKRVENYFSRVNIAMTRGKFCTNLGVLHPVESYWLAYGTEEKTGQLRRALDENFEMLTSWLIGDTKDFDLICESLMDQLYKGCADGRACMGEMSYSTILAPNMLTMRSSTLRMLREFKQAGGRILFTGYTPEYLDGVPSEEVKTFVRECEWVSFHRFQLLSALDGVSDLDILESDGQHTDNLITQMRDDGGERWVFVAHKSPKSLENVVGADASTKDHPRMMRMKKDRTMGQKITLRLRGEWAAKVYDAWNGKAEARQVTRKKGYTYLEATLYAQDSLLVRFIPAMGECRVQQENKEPQVLPVAVEPRVPVTLSEPNVLLLDLAEFAFDEGHWQPEEEILRIDNKFRDDLGLPYRMEAFPQPWVMQENQAPSHTLHLRFTVEAEITVSDVELALEHPQDCQITFNGVKISSAPIGGYVDRDIYRIALGKVEAGKNILEVFMPFCRKTDVESMYLLGDFGVRVAGRKAVITAPVRQMGFGDWVMEGLPFYGGTVTYHMEVEGTGNPLRVQLSKFRCPVMTVALNGVEQGAIAISPYIVDTEPTRPGKNTLDLTVYGNRFNTFGIVHNVLDDEDNYCSPNAWRTKGSLWAYEYQLRQTGPLKAPDVFEIKQDE